MKVFGAMVVGGVVALLAFAAWRASRMRAAPIAAVDTTDPTQTTVEGATVDGAVPIGMDGFRFTPTYTAPVGGVGPYRVNLAAFPGGATIGQYGIAVDPRIPGTRAYDQSPGPGKRWFNNRYEWI